MKKFITLHIVAFLMLTTLFSCRKDSVLPAGGKLPTLTINKISELPFSNTEWKHVFGGMAEIKYINGSTTTTDSLDLTELSTYQKTMELGTYDIQLRSKSGAVADTFIRFSAELKGLVVDKGQALSLAGVTKDGLITIKKESIKEKTVPTFTPSQAGAKSYKMGLIDGYYFIYVTGGIVGQVSFESKGTGDRITKDLTIAATNHYNLVVVTNGTSSIGVVLRKFAYNEIQVSSSTLIKIQTPGFMNSGFDYTFVIADDTGKILNSYKYTQGTTLMQVDSKEPYTKDRVSVFLLSRRINDEIPPRIDAYMNVKKGSTWTVPNYPPSRRYYYPLQVSLKTIPVFKTMTFSTDRGSFPFNFSSDLSTFAELRFSFSEVSKVFFQIENDGKAFYNFFDIISDARSFEIDPALCTMPSASKAISLPGPGNIRVYGKKDKNYSETYFLGSQRFESGKGTYFYPNEPFEEYATTVHYELNGMLYADSFTGAQIPQTSTPINLRFEPNGNWLSTFQPTFTGEFDHYMAQFVNGSLIIEVVSPSSGLFSKLSYPDLAAFSGFADFNASSMVLTSIEAYQYEGFAENQLPYKFGHQHNLNGKSVHKGYLRPG